MGQLRKNSNQQVQQVTGEVMKMLGDSTGKKKKATGLKDVMNKLCELKGIGPATASALLAHIDPQRFPFMSDEALEGCGMKREYTLATYLSFAEALSSKAEALGGEWNAETVGRAMWARAMIHAHGSDMNEKDGEGKRDDEQEDEENSKRKKRKRK